MPSINASLGIGQLKKFNSILKIKKIIHNQYKYFIEKNYSDYFTVLSEPKNCKSNFWLNVLKLNKPSKKNVDKIIKHLISRDIHVGLFGNHYIL